MKELEMTGERLVTSFNNHYGKFEHLHRYALASEFVKDKIVLDIACGEGYGTNLLSLKSKTIFGVDISEEAVSHAKVKYVRENLSYKLGTASDIPFESHYFDVVISFETIEHLVEQEKMFEEIKRVLKPDGVLILSSPDKSIYSQRDPNNIYHVKELLVSELNLLVDKHFENKIQLKQIISVGSLIIPIDGSSSKFKTFDGNYYELKESFEEYDFFNKPYFNIVICCDSKLDLDNYALTSMYNSYEVYNSLLTDKDNEIKYLESKLQGIRSNKYFKIMKKIQNLF